MSAKNDITGDSIQSREPNDAYRQGWERIFGEKPVAPFCYPTSAWTSVEMDGAQSEE